MDKTTNQFNQHKLSCSLRNQSHSDKLIVADSSGAAAVTVVNQPTIGICPAELLLLNTLIHLRRSLCLDILLVLPVYQPSPGVFEYYLPALAAVGYSALQHAAVIVDCCMEGLSPPNPPPIMAASAFRTSQSWHAWLVAVAAVAAAACVTAWMACSCMTAPPPPPHPHCRLLQCAPSPHPST